MEKTVGWVPELRANKNDFNIIWLTKYISTINFYFLNCYNSPRHGDHACNPRTLGAEAGRAHVRVQPEQFSNTFPQSGGAGNYLSVKALCSFCSTEKMAIIHLKIYTHSTYR